jgi:hypothetical protein
MVPVAILGASVVPVGIAMAPRLKRPPPTVSNELSAAPKLLQIPERAGEYVEGLVIPIGERVSRFLAEGKCAATVLVGFSKDGKVVLRARRSAPFQVKSEARVVVVRGAVEVVGAEAVSSNTLNPKLVKSLGLKEADLAEVTWREYVLVEGATVRAYGTPEKGQVREMAAYRDQYVDVLEAPEGVFVVLA